MKKNSLKGFTLLELIVVMAIFSGLMVGVMALLNPVQKLYHRSAEYEDAGADLDNIRQYIEDNLRYADKVNVYTGYDSLPALIGSSDAADLPEVQLKAGTTNDYEKVNVQTNPLDFFRKYYYNNDVSKYSDLFIMEISNEPSSVNASGQPTGSMGNVCIYSLDLKTDNYSVVSEASGEYYKKYSFNFNLDPRFDYDHAVMNINIFKNDFKDSDGNGKYFEELMRDNTDHPDTAASFSFLNIANSPEITVNTSLSGDIVEDSEIQKNNGKITKKALRYKLFDSGTPSDKIYFIYTTPEILFE